MKPNRSQFFDLFLILASIPELYGLVARRRNQGLLMMRLTGLSRLG
ncbi:MAG TPA: hypothetical protein VMF06_06940 [Candidatus Limnocylindria bacterium]|jgi:hypothetical protein|nr:hypothetical protein [Candidatus Limnocylindria bacterium]